MQPYGHMGGMRPAGYGHMPQHQQMGRPPQQQMRPGPYGQVGGGCGAWRPGMPPQHHQGQYHQPPQQYGGGCGGCGGGGGCGGPMAGRQMPPMPGHQAGRPMPGQGGYGGQGAHGGGSGHSRSQPSAAAPSRSSKGPPRREMDSLLEEMKARQRAQQEKKDTMKDAESRAAESPGSGGPADFGGCGGLGGGGSMGISGRGPPGSSSMPSALGRGGSGSGLGAGNAAGAAARGGVAPEPQVLFLRELPRSVTEDALCMLFSRYGVVTGVDIVRPQDASEKITGYITLDSLDTAQRAKDALQDREVDSVPLWIEWAKEPVPQLLDTPQDGRDGCRHVLIEPPIDKLKRRIIDRLAKYVAQEGHPFEQIVMERESPDGMFSFLFKHDSEENRYYRWRTYAFAQGDNFKVWRTETFRICDGGAWWRPPPCEAAVEKRLRSTNFSSGPAQRQQAKDQAQQQAQQQAGAAASASSGAPAEAPAPPKPKPSTLVKLSKEEMVEDAERQRVEERATQERQRRDRDKKGIAGGKRLTDDDWDKLEKLLRSVNTSRCTILETMVFCLDKCDQAIEIAECITESLTIMETDIPLKLARLMVVSDVLHNTASSRSGAWAYRREFERSLPDIFEHFNLAISRQESRLAADRAKEQVGRLLKIWEDWGLFAPQYVRGLEAALTVGVKRLRVLAAKGDSSREPAWLEPKLADWRRQHFSQLEKMCRTRGLRCSTGHLEGTKECSLEEARKDWLIDRLVCFELHWHEKEQARQASSSAFMSKMSKGGSFDDIDGEAIECDIDGFPLDETELDGEPFAIDAASGTAGGMSLMRLLEVARFTPDAGLNGRYLGEVPEGSATSSAASARRGAPAGAFSVLGSAPHIQDQQPAPSEEVAAADEVVGLVLPTSGSATDAAGSKAEAKPRADASRSRSRSGRRRRDGDEESDEIVDIARPSPPANSASSAEPKQPADEDGSEVPKIDKSSMRNIELEVMELRASLLSQGLHRDAIEDICDEKRQRMIEEQEGGNAGNEKSDEGAAKGPGASDEAGSDSEGEKQAQQQKQEQKAKEKGRAKAKVNAKEKEKEKREREKEKEKEKQRQAKAKEEKTKQDRSKEEKAKQDRAKEKEKEVRAKEKEKERKEKEKEKAKEQEKEKAKKRAKSRSRSKDKGSKKVRK